MNLSITRLDSSAPPPRTDTETLARAAMDEVAMVVGSAAALHQLDDDLVWTVMKRLDLVRVRFLRDLKELTSRTQGDAAPVKPPQVHTAVEEFLVRNCSGGGRVSSALPAVKRLSELSVPRQALARLCQSLNYGQVLELVVRNGEPIFDPEPNILVEVKLDGNGDGQRQEADLPDFALREELCRLMACLDRLKNGRIERIEVRAGVPRLIVMRRPLAEASL
jgi:hypothetical protein